MAPPTIYNFSKKLMYCEPFCNCKFPTCIYLADFKGHISELIKCRCGQEAQPMSWTWHNKNEDIADINGPHITFHPTYSQGTAIVRGNRELEIGMVHFWEMRILTTLGGTDVMFGLGTDQKNLNEFNYHFVSALGIDKQSWGYSYNGYIQHNGEQEKYGQRFSQGCIVGIYLDRVQGYMEFFLNRRSLGVAYTNIPTDSSIKLYPMVSSTAAKSCITLINATSQPDSLQLRAFKMLTKNPHGMEQLKRMAGLNVILQRSYWFLALSTRYSPFSTDDETIDLADEAVVSRPRARKRSYAGFYEADEEIRLVDLLTEYMSHYYTSH